MDYEQLINQKMKLITQFESGQKQYLRENEEIIRPQTPQFSDRKRKENQNNNSFVILKEQTQQQIVVNWQGLSDLMEIKQFEEQDFYNFMNQLKLNVNRSYWNFFLLLSYSEETWKQTIIPEDKIMQILGLVFDCVQEINEQKIQQIEEIINYRSLAHLDRILFQNKLPQFEKFIIMLREQIFENPHEVFTFKEILKEKQFDSFAKIPGYKSYTPTKQQNSKGIERSYKLFNYSKQLQEKANHLQKEKNKIEIQEIKNLQQKCKTPQKNKDEVFQRLFNDSKSFQTKIQKQQINDDKILDKECTFKPQIVQTTIKNEYQQNLIEIKGVDNIIKRMQKAQKEKEFKEKYFENKQQQLQKNNQTKQVKEFKLSEKEDIENPILFLDIRISKNKIGRLGIRRNDDIKQVVKNFAKAFSLQNNQIDLLEQHINIALEKLKSNK